MQYSYILSAALFVTSTLALVPRQSPTFTVKINATQSDIHNTRPDAIVECEINKLCDSPDTVVSALTIVPDSGTNQLNTTAVECRSFTASNPFDPSGAPAANVPFDTVTKIGIATNARAWTPVICYLRAVGETNCGGNTFSCGA
ncbi:hypothetical protein EJ05DRAFT_485752 [Pseudovirgaria hyperparasitica]|uniref:Uncharacterized protein n=1 Tax=Pseudovirgaria hyperparasitica TaxID=470096 RepID=A0A6A6W7P0_9PEZI|nr:uncharacterized protein EJ05DRAFT_485752 [Pseudovirgaria hyperparasitica]KAF2758653.1 hypothetical protein EJ05DRAFT_485752 [Pseudovirgaria hyperparasitica]